MKRMIIGALSIIVVLGATGCATAAEQVAEDIAGEVIGGEVNVEDGGVTVDTPGGAVTVGVDTLPDGFPADFPIPEAGILESSSRVAVSEGTDFYVNLVSDDALTDVLDWYKAELAAQGWEMETEVQVPGDTSTPAMLVAKKGTMTGTITLTAGDPSTRLVIVVNVK